MTQHWHYCPTCKDVYSCDCKVTAYQHQCSDCREDVEEQNSPSFDRWMDEQMARPHDDEGNLIEENDAD